MFLFLSPGSREPVVFVLEVMLLEMANIDIHEGSFHFHVFLVTSYCYVILLFCSLVFQLFFCNFPTQALLSWIANSMTEVQGIL